MVKLNALTLLNGLLRSQCIQGRVYCHENSQQQQHNQDITGYTYLLPKALRCIMDNTDILASLDGKRLSPSHLFISGPSTPDAVEFTMAVLCLLYNHYPKFRCVFSTYEQLEIFRLLKQVPKNLVIKYQKYITAELPNLYLEQEDHNKIPDRFFEYFDSVFGYTKRVKHFLKNRLVCKKMRNLSFWNSWLQGIKRACKEAEDEVLYDNYIDHSQVLSKRPEGELSHSIKTYMIRVAEVIHTRPIRYYEASNSASYTTPRSQGGQRSDVRNWLIKKYGIKTYKDHEIDGTTFELWGPNIPEPKIVARDIVQDFLVRDGIMSPLHVKVHGILEPLKVRKITKGESVPYWFCRSLQKDWWDSLQSYPQFAPTGRPIERYDIHCLIDRERAIEAECPLGFDSWVSGDYSAATDGVDIRVTMGILEHILKYSPLDENEKDIARAVLGPQVISYPKVPGHRKIPSFTQQTGQLMGSILSFPILCLINIITYWKTLEEYTGHTYKLSQLPCIVNGDDILFRANREFYELWKENIKLVGFTMSVGKNYFHKDTFLINSQMFKIFGNPLSKYSLVRVPMYNIGLLTGKAKTTGRNSQQVKPLWSWYDEVIGGAHDKWEAHKRFLYYHKDTLYQLTDHGRYNLFAPRWLGGCGFTLTPEVAKHTRLTFFQQMLATYVRYQVKQDCTHGRKPTRFTLRLVQEEEGDRSQYVRPYYSKARTSIKLGFKDRYRLIPLTQPLNMNESLDLERQHKLPLMANIPSVFDKPEMKVLYPHRVSFKTMFNILSKHGKIRPLPKSVIFNKKQFRLVSVTEPTLSHLLRDKENDELIDFDQFVVIPQKSNVDLSGDIRIYTDECNDWTLRYISGKRLGRGITLVIHSE